MKKTQRNDSEKQTAEQIKMCLRIIKTLECACYDIFIGDYFCYVNARSVKVVWMETPD